MIDEVTKLGWCVCLHIMEAHGGATQMKKNRDSTNAVKKTCELQITMVDVKDRIIERDPEGYYD